MRRRFPLEVASLEGRLVCSDVLLVMGPGVGTGPLPTMDSGTVGGLLGPVDSPPRVGPEIDLDDPNSYVPPSHALPDSTLGGGGDWSLPDGDYLVPDSTLVIV